MTDEKTTLKTICVYCGSSDKVRPAYIDGAYRMGQAIAKRGLQLWYGAGSTGLMGAVARGTLESGGEVVGVIPEIFNTPQLAHSTLTRLEVVENMHVRKARLADQADAYIALPGGYGTFEELFEMLTWAQIGLHHKPIGLLNLEHYFDPLLAMVGHARDEGFIYAEHLALFSVSTEPESLLDQMLGYSPPVGLDRWLLRDE